MIKNYIDYTKLILEKTIFKTKILNNNFGGWNEFVLSNY